MEFVKQTWVDKDGDLHDAVKSQDIIGLVANLQPGQSLQSEAGDVVLHREDEALWTVKSARRIVHFHNDRSPLVEFLRQAASWELWEEVSRFLDGKSGFKELKRVWGRTR